MANVNTVILIGTLTRDPEVKYLPKGTAVAQVSLAINRTWTDDSGTRKEEVTFVEVEFWGRVAEIVGEYCKKGKPIYVDGRLRLETWDDKTTGQKRSKLKVVANSIQLLGSKSDGETKPEQRPPAARKPAAPPPRPPADPDLDGDDGDGVPF